jgi:26S proteasome regulatory subunit N10
VQIAQLALKHRKNKNGGQRIIAFVGSPIQEEMPVLQKIGKQLKKNNVAIDVINMGEVEENNEKLQKFVEAVNSNDNSHLISIPAGVQPLDAINASPILHMGGNAFGGGAVGGAGGAGGNFDEYGGIDPAMDPELAMAIRVSTEEARANEEARAAQGATTGGSTDTPAAAAAPAGISRSDDCFSCSITSSTSRFLL